MIIGIGNDVAELARFEKLIQQDDDAFARKVLTASEMEIFSQLTDNAKVRFLAGRFSVKEAFAKAMGTGIGKGTAFHDIETLNNAQGKPVTTAKTFHARILTTISHSKTEVYTIVILED